MRVIALAALLVAAGTLYAADPEHLHEADPGADPQAVHCIDLIRIQSTEIIDNRRIVFRMRGGQLFLNTLPIACPGLRRNEPYMVKAHGSQLCDLDILTVLNRGGFAFMPGASCGLGRFEPVTKQQVDAVKRASRKGE
jgi:hypothetical protein